jgi:uncharacterized protein YndB with AHSA1/START domain
MSTESNPSVCIVRRFNYPAERVFDAWLDPALAGKWLFATSTGKMVRAEIDPRVGGRFTFTDRRDGEDVEHSGEYLEIDRPRRLVFTFGVPKYSPNLDRVTVEIEPQGGGCELTLTHEMKPEFLEYASRTEDGWTQIMEGLAASLGEELAATNLKPGEFTAPGEVRFVRLLPGPIERVWEYLTNSEKRKTWFAGGPMELKQGGRMELHFRHIEIAPHETPPEEHKIHHDPGIKSPGEITRCEPPRVLAFTWGGDASGDSSEVTFELSPHGDQVKLVLTHRRLGPDRQELIGTSAGWHTHLRILVARLSGTKPPPFWSPLKRFEADYAKRLA